MVGLNGDILAFKIHVEIGQCPYYSQAPFDDGIVTLPGEEVPAGLGNRVFFIVLVFLGQHRPKMDIRCISLEDEWLPRVSHLQNQVSQGFLEPRNSFPARFVKVGLVRLTFLCQVGKWGCHC